MSNPFKLDVQQRARPEPARARNPFSLIREEAERPEPPERRERLTTGPFAGRAALGRGIPRGLARSAVATARAVVEPDIPGAVAAVGGPISQFLRIPGVEAVLPEPVRAALETVRGVRRDALELTGVPQLIDRLAQGIPEAEGAGELIGEITGRILGDIAQIAAVRRAPPVARLARAAPTAPRAERVAREVATTVPIPVAQAAASPEESTALAIAQLTGERAPRVTAALEAIGSTPIGRAAVEVALDVALSAPLVGRALTAGEVAARAPAARALRRQRRGAREAVEPIPERPLSRVDVLARNPFRTAPLTATERAAARAAPAPAPEPPIRPAPEVEVPPEVQARIDAEDVPTVVTGVPDEVPISTLRDRALRGDPERPLSVPGQREAIEAIEPTPAARARMRTEGFGEPVKLDVTEDGQLRVVDEVDLERIATAEAVFIGRVPVAFTDDAVKSGRAAAAVEQRRFQRDAGSALRDEPELARLRASEVKALEAGRRLAEEGIEPAPVARRLAGEPEPEAPRAPELVREEPPSPEVQARRRRELEEPLPSEAELDLQRRQILEGVEQRVRAGSMTQKEADRILAQVEEADVRSARTARILEDLEEAIPEAPARRRRPLELVEEEPEAPKGPKFGPSRTAAAAERLIEETRRLREKIRGGPVPRRPKPKPKPKLKIVREDVVSPGPRPKQATIRELLGAKEAQPRAAAVPAIEGKPRSGVKRRIAAYDQDVKQIKTFTGRQEIDRTEALRQNAVKQLEADVTAGRLNEKEAGRIRIQLDAAARPAVRLGARPDFNKKFQDLGDQSLEDRYGEVLNRIDEASQVRGAGTQTFARETPAGEVVTGTVVSGPAGRAQATLNTSERLIRELEEEMLARGIPLDEILERFTIKELGQDVTETTVRETLTDAVRNERGAVPAGPGRIEPPKKPRTSAEQNGTPRTLEELKKDWNIGKPLGSKTEKAVEVMTEPELLSEAATIRGLTLSYEQPWDPAVVRYWNSLHDRAAQLGIDLDAKGGIGRIVLRLGAMDKPTRFAPTAGAGPMRRTPRETLFDDQVAAVETFGITTDPNEGGYILTDGRMLDFSGKKEGGPSGGRFMDHREIGMATGDGGTEGMLDFMREGNVRMAHFRDDKALSLDISRPLTDRQSATIRRMLAGKVREHGVVELIVDFTDPLTGFELVRQGGRQHFTGGAAMRELEEIIEQGVKRIGERGAAFSPGGLRGMPGGILTPITTAGVGGLAGAAIADQDNRLEGALLGLAVGAGAPFAIRAIARGAAPAAPPPTKPLTRRAANAATKRRLIGDRRRRLTQQAGVPEGDFRVQLNRFGLSDDGTARVLQQAEELKKTGEIRKKRVSFKETQEIASDLGIDDIRQADVNDNLTSFDMLAIRQAYRRNDEELTKLFTRLEALQDGRVALDPKQAIVEQRNLAMAIDVLESDNAELVRMFIPRASEFGRQLNSLKIIAKQTVDPFRWRTMATRAAGRDLTVEEGLELSILVRKAQKAKGKPDEQLALFDLAEFTNDLAPPIRTFSLEALNQIRRAGLLTGLRTQARNFLSNTGEWAMGWGDQMGAVLTDRLAGWIVGRASGGRVKDLRTRAFLSPKARAIASAQGAKRGVKEMRRIMRGKPPTIGELRKLDLTRNQNIENRWVNGYVKFMYRMQGAADQPARQAALQISLREQAELVARRLPKEEQAAAIQTFMRKPPDDAVIQAMLDAEEAVFQNASVVGTFLSGAKQKTRQFAARGGLAPQAAGTVLRLVEFVIPFTQTPASILGRIIERTPLGLLSSLKGLNDLARLASKGQIDLRKLEILQRQIATRAGRAATGSVAILLGMELARRNLMSGPYPDEPRERRRWGQNGKIADAVFIQGRWRRVSGISPLGNLLALGAQLFIEGNDPEYDAPDERITALALGSARTFLDQSFLRGTKEFIDGVTNRFGGKKKFVRGAAGSLVPTIIKDVTRVVDPVLRNPTNTAESVKARVPYYSFEVPVRTDPLGQTIIPEPRLRDRLLRLIDPFDSREPRTARDPIIDRLDRINVVIPRVDRNKDEEPVAWLDRQQRIGESRRRALRDLFRNSAFNRLPVEVQREAAEKIVAEARRVFTATGEIPPDFRSDAQRIVVRARTAATRRRQEARARR